MTIAHTMDSTVYYKQSHCCSPHDAICWWLYSAQKETL